MWGSNTTTCTTIPPSFESWLCSNDTCSINLAQARLAYVAVNSVVNFPPFYDVEKHCVSKLNTINKLIQCCTWFLLYYMSCVGVNSKQCFKGRVGNAGKTSKSKLFWKYPTWKIPFPSGLPLKHMNVHRWRTSPHARDSIGLIHKVVGYIVQERSKFPPKTNKTR